MRRKPPLVARGSRLLDESITRSVHDAASRTAV
jgi:hypothetical protein